MEETLVFEISVRDLLFLPVFRVAAVTTGYGVQTAGLVLHLIYLKLLPWPKKIETGTQAKHRCVHARQITRLCHVRAVVSIFLARVVYIFGN